MYTTVKRRFDKSAYKVVDVWAEEQNKAESEAKVSRLYGI